MANKTRPIETFGRRIKTARNHAKLTQMQVADAIAKLPYGDSFKQQTLSKLENSKTTDRSEYTVHIAVVCGVNPVWLATGMGKRFDTDTDDYVVGPLVKELLHLPRTTQAQIIAYSAFLAGQSGDMATAVNMEKLAKSLGVEITKSSH